jgi:hypothetical protein
VSDEFMEFITKLDAHYKTFGLELSALVYKNPDILVQYLRKQKLKRILK